MITVESPESELPPPGAAYLGEDRTLAELLRTGCSERGLPFSAPRRPSDARSMVDSQRVGAMVVDRGSRVIPEGLARQLRDAPARAVVRYGQPPPVVQPAERGQQLVDQLATQVRDARRAASIERLLLGRSAAMAEVRAQILSVADFPDVNVLVVGETGTGKDLVGRALHKVGPRPDTPYVPINCAAIASTLFESELFGHRAGTFTGAAEHRVGLLQEAGRGTVLLDEVGEMPPALQPKLLRTLDARTLRSVGSNREVEFEARVVSATNRETADFAGLRSDLFFRLAGFVVRMPALRDRREDIPMLAARFRDDFAGRHGMAAPELSDAALDALDAHRWPGNVRELKHVIERAVIVARTGRVTGDHIRGGHFGAPRPARAPSSAPPPHAPPHAPRKALRRVERDLILGALVENDGNVARTARQLDIPRSTLRARLRRYERESPGVTSCRADR